MMTYPNGYTVKGKMYPAETVRCEQAMLEYITELEAENKRLLEAAQTIWRRSQKMSPLDNTWVQDVILTALAGERCTG